MAGPIKKRPNSPKGIIRGLTPALEAAFTNSGFVPATATGRGAVPSVTPLQSATPERKGGGFDLTNVQTAASFDQAGGGGGVNPLTSTSLDYLKGQDVETSIKLKQKNRRKGARSTE